MNRILIVSFALYSLAASAVIPDEAQAQITAYKSNHDGDGYYRFSYETSNGIKREETGFLVYVGQENEHMVVTGSYSYTDPDGNLVSVTYTADENGFQFNPPRKVTYSLHPNVVASLLGK